MFEQAFRNIDDAPAARAESLMREAFSGMLAEETLSVLESVGR